MTKKKFDLLRSGMSADRQTLAGKCALDLMDQKRRTRAAGLGDRFSNHTFRGAGITAYLSNDGDLERAQYMAGHASPRSTKLYDRREQEATLDDVERILL